MLIEEIHFPHNANDGHFDISEYIYLESSFNEEYNSYISSHYDELQKDIIANHYTLAYLPVVCEQLTHSKSLGYYIPSISEEDRQMILRLTTAEYTRRLTGDKMTLQPMLARYLRRNGRTDVWQAVFFDPKQNPEDEFKEFFRYLARGGNFLSDEFLQFSMPNHNEFSGRMLKARLSIRQECSSPKPQEMCFGMIREPEAQTAGEIADEPEVLDNYADDTWDDDMKVAALVAMRSVQHLREHGVRESVIQELLRTNLHISPIIVREDYTIYLPEFKMEFDFKPIWLAVYVLFLSHPEGIILKQRADYRKELEAIYRTITSRVDDESIKRTLDRLCDPLNNSMNEICARIRTEIISKMHESLADKYCITGQRGEAKYIPIAREEGKVVWE